MPTQLFYKIGSITICCFLFVSFNSCNGQAKIDGCKESYKNANKNLNAYYKSENQSLLQNAIVYVEQSMTCEETRRKAIHLKISLLILSKSYKWGYEFIDTLNQNDFGKSYKKQMHHDFFKALEYESKSDTLNARKLYTKIIESLDDYIQSESNFQKALDQEAYYDLFFVKSKLLPQSQINTELDELAQKLPADKVFFITLKSSFDVASKETNAIPDQ